MPRTVLLDGDPTAPQQARLGAALAARGYRVVVLDAPEIAAQIRREFHQTCQQLSSLPGRLGPLRAWQLQRAARRLGVEVVHLNYIAPKQRAWADDPLGLPYIATVWGSDLNREVFRLSAVHEAAIDRILAGASAITADTWSLIRKAEERIGATAAPRQLVLWSADLGQFDPQRARPRAQRFREQLGIGAGVRVLLSPRQPQPHYHLEQIVTGFAQSRWRECGVLLQALHGREGERAYLERVLSHAQHLGVRHQLILAPRRDYSEVAGLYAVADAAVSLLEADGVPSTFLELMALQVPIVATDLPAYQGVLVGEERGLLVPPNDPMALARALDRLLDEPGLAARLAAAGRTWALEHADWSRSVQQWIDLYEHAIRSPRPRSRLSRRCPGTGMR